jgi:GTPase
MFLDEVKINVKGGNGGRGCVSWRREKYISKGGPDGGDGGNGGSVYIIADDNTDTLSGFRSQKRFEAEKGQYGMKKNKRGRTGEDLYLKVPPGTVVVYESDQLIADLAHANDQILIAKGGKGGFGNAHFKSSTRQRPDFAELGEPGEEKKLKLELKLVADVGIIGYPSVGKSTLISVISAARPKIGDYPFTTIIPNLGVVTVDDRSYTVCDVPGLIEGAADGKGLGHQFLKHVERCGVLLHLLDVNREDIVDDYKKLRTELEKYSPELAKKKEIVVLNKIDLFPNYELRITNYENELKNDGIEIFASISAATHQGTDELAKKLLTIVLEEREANRSSLTANRSSEAQQLPVLQPHLQSLDMGAYRIEEKNGAIIIHGTRIEQFTKMTDFNSQGGVNRFRDVLERIGLMNTLKKCEGDIFIGEIKVDEFI